MSIRRPRPDFRLVAVPTHDIHPDATTIGQGGRGWLDVLASREDGFDEPIRVEATGLPPGVDVRARSVIGPGKTSVPLVFEAAPDAPIGQGRIHVKGTSTIDGRERTRTARGGGLTWPTVNTPGISRMADGVPQWPCARPRRSSSTPQPATIEVEPGDKLSIALTVERAGDWTGPVSSPVSTCPATRRSPWSTLPPTPGRGQSRGGPAGQPEAGDVHLHHQRRRAGAPRLLRQRDPKEPRGNNVRAIFPSNPITINVAATSTSGPPE